MRGPLVVAVALLASGCLAQQPPSTYASQTSQSTTTTTFPPQHYVPANWTTDPCDHGLPWFGDNAAPIPGIMDNVTDTVRRLTETIGDPVANWTPYHDRDGNPIWNTLQGGVYVYGSATEGYSITFNTLVEFSTSNQSDMHKKLHVLLDALGIPESLIVNENYEPTSMHGDVAIMDAQQEWPFNGTRPAVVSIWDYPLGHKTDIYVGSPLAYNWTGPFLSYEQAGNVAVSFLDCLLHGQGLVPPNGTRPVTNWAMGLSHRSIVYRIGVTYAYDPPKPTHCGGSWRSYLLQVDAVTKAIHTWGLTGREDMCA